MPERFKGTYKFLWKLSNFCVEIVENHQYYCGGRLAFCFYLSNWRSLFDIRGKMGVRNLPQKTPQLRKQPKIPDQMNPYINEAVDLYLSLDICNFACGVFAVCSLIWEMENGYKNKL